MADVLQYDLKSVRAYLLKESFQLFWNYKSPYWAEWYLKKWCARAMRSRVHHEFRGNNRDRLREILQLHHHSG